MLKEKLDPFPWLMKIMNILIFRLLVFQPKSEKEARWRGKETRCFREENLYQHQHFFLINTNVSIIYWYLLQYQSSRQFPQHTFWLQLYIFFSRTHSNCPQCLPVHDAVIGVSWPGAIAKLREYLLQGNNC